MNADTINKKVRISLVENGFRGIISIIEARRIINEVLKKLNIKTHRIIIEPDPFHQPGGVILCNCSKSVIKVELIT